MLALPTVPRNASEARAQSEGRATKGLEVERGQRQYIYSLQRAHARGLGDRDGAKRKARALTSILGYDLGYTTSMGYPGR